MPRKPPPVTPADDLDTRIGRLHADGCDFTEIAVRLSLTRSEARERLAALGLADSPPDPGADPR